MRENIMKGVAVLFTVIVVGVIALFVVLHSRNEAQAVGESDGKPTGPDKGQPITPADVEELDVNTETGTAPALVVTGRLRRTGLWLGVSAVPRNVTDPAKEAKTFTFPLAQAEFKETVNLDKTFAGGGFSVAVWQKKVEKRDCNKAGGPPCPWCEANGSHMEGLLAEREGRIGGGPKVVLAVKINSDSTSGEPIALEISGEVSGLETNCWFGTSLYPKDCIDLAKDGQHKTEEMPNGEFSATLPLGERFAGGSCEIAVWEKKVNKLDCKRPFCAYCNAAGCHFEGSLAYKTDLIKDIVRAKLATKVETVFLPEKSTEFPYVLKIEGKVHLKDVKAYLGYSLYPDPREGKKAEATHEIPPAPAAAFSTSVDVPVALCGGTYEVALWRTKVDKKDCKRENCQVCSAKGFHVEGLLAYEFGVLPRQQK
ncbi:MAG: hypothetical protein RDV41_04885 [Planctomycetota bacterium]|nr:hypothetical protein [Planctomycetota bacterium]